jgi:hypothetical protein
MKILVNIINRGGINYHSLCGVMMFAFHSTPRYHHRCVGVILSSGKYALDLLQVLEIAYIDVALGYQFS